jgi:hypothetical protein
MHATTISMHQSNLKRKFLDVVVTDQHYLQVKESPHQENVQQRNKEYEIKENGLIMHKNTIYVHILGEIRNMVLK